MIKQSIPSVVSKSMLDYLSGQKPHEILYPNEAYRKHIYSPHLAHELIDAATPLGEAAAVTPFIKELTHSLETLFKPESLHAIQGVGKGVSELAESETNNFVEFMNKLYENLFKSKSKHEEHKKEKEPEKKHETNLANKMLYFPW